ncbi:MAG: phosphomannomutase/phosphoglucomutase [Actinomycetota bacterium]|nr:phosphomannomutase/phosphoglucomutase [Actinomycetota bacterium]MDH5224346.1 phosphomannomutase/phosphoglucomutase [Actinomycetota bacterium]
MPSDLDRIFKAYDVRGVVPDDLDADLVRDIGAAFAAWSGARSIVVGRDCRLSSPELAAAIAEGATSRGVDVVDLGLASTDLLYFASGSLDMPGIMLTASHNPKQYNGLKFCLAGAKPVGEDTGLRDIRATVEQGVPPPSAGRGVVEERDLLEAYVEHVLTFVDVDAMRPLTIVADTANGMGGLVVPAVMARLPVRLHHLFPELDGTFPNHPADPIDPENQRDLKAAVLEHRADIGLAFDGDADRVFLIDEHAQDVSGSLLTALVAIAMLERDPGAKIVHNLICSWTVPEVIREHGGVPVRTRVGHSFIKQVMAETGAVFGGEHSGHYYFRENYRADSGLIAAVAALGELSKADSPVSELLAPLRRYSASGEINSVVEDQHGRIEEIARHYDDGRQDRLDGLTVEFDDWWFNVRPSNTEPLLRLNAEARTPELLADKTAEVLALIRGDDGA